MVEEFGRASLDHKQREAVSIIEEGSARTSSLSEAALALARRADLYAPESWRSIGQCATTLLLFIGCLGLIGWLSSTSYWLALPISIPAAGLLVRLFIIQHDCGHGSYFASRGTNDRVGSVLSVLTLTPYAAWKSEHNAHHATSGNLDRRGRGDVITLTVAEYRSSSLLKRLGYRLYRSPFIMVLVGAPINFVVLQRVAVGQSLRDWKAARSIIRLNLALIVVVGLAALLFGLARVALVYLPVMVVASWIGNWLFFVQHQFEGVYWKRNGEWNFRSAGVSGGSYFKLNPILQWFSGNIGLHHIHHLCSRIPNYNLQRCLIENGELGRYTKVITLRDSVKCWSLALWDEERGRLVGFRELRR